LIVKHELWCLSKQESNKNWNGNSLEHLEQEHQGLGFDLEQYEVKLEDCFNQ